MAEDAKIIRLYHYMPAKYAEEFLRKDEIKLCDLTKSNDLCEFSPRVGGLAEKDLLYRLKFENHRANFSARNPMLVLSFSSRVSSSAVWGHYADQNKGICLVFEFFVENLHEQYGVIMGTIPDISAQFHKVTYTDTRFEIPVSAYMRGDEEIFSYLCSAISHKSTDWSYEKEFRLVFYVDEESRSVIVKDELFFALGLRKYLVGVVMGARCQMSDLYLKAVLREVASVNIDRNLKKRLSNIKIARAKIDELQMNIQALPYKDFIFNPIAKTRLTL